MDNPTPITTDWFSGQMCIPSGQIEDLNIEAHSIAMDFPINFSTLENLRVLRTTLWDVQFTEGFLRTLHPYLGAGVSCPSLREIKYAD